RGSAPGPEPRFPLVDIVIATMSPASVARAHPVGVAPIFTLPAWAVFQMSSQGTNPERPPAASTPGLAEFQHQWVGVALSSIGDAVITADVQGRITFMNPVAESLTGWQRQEAEGRPLDQVFRIVDEENHAPVENPALRAIREGTIFGLANHTLLLA